MLTTLNCANNNGNRPGDTHSNLKQRATIHGRGSTRTNRRGLYWDWKKVSDYSSCHRRKKRLEEVRNWSTEKFLGEINRPAWTWFADARTDLGNSALGARLGATQLFNFQGQQSQTRNWSQNSKVTLKSGTKRESGKINVASNARTTKTRW